MVKLQDVSFSYTKDAGTLTHVDLTIKPGECVLLCGASGCGKTTLLRHILNEQHGYKIAVIECVSELNVR